MAKSTTVAKPRKGEGPATLPPKRERPMKRLKSATPEERLNALEMQFGTLLNASGELTRLVSGLSKKTDAFVRDTTAELNTVLAQGIKTATRVEAIQEQIADAPSDVRTDILHGVAAIIALFGAHDTPPKRFSFIGRIGDLEEGADPINSHISLNIEA